MTKRPPIPADLSRSVLIEAGHRCAIPTCRQVPVEIAHIVAWSKCKEHKIENLIALCPTCHTRFDRGEIDRQSMLAYKQKLSLINNKYGEFEERLIKIFSKDPGRQDVWILNDLEILIMYLLEDGLIRPTGLVDEIKEKSFFKKQYVLTELGRDYLGRRFPPEPYDPDR